MSKSFLNILLASVFAFQIAACTKKDSAGSGDKAASENKKGGPLVGLVLDKGGKDDKSFNTAAYKGSKEAVEKLGIELKDIEIPDDTAFEPALRSLAERGASLVIAIGFSQKDALQKVAPQFPKTKFAIVDAPVDAPNVESLMFAEHEGSYMAGYLAALASKTGSIGFVGGMEVPLIKRFQIAYEAGAKAAKPDIKVLVNYVGTTSDAWANPTRGKELALNQFGQKADIIFAAAGASGLGVFDAAEEKKLFAIGVDSNQNWVKPGFILTSMLKRVDLAVYDAIESIVKNSFKSGVKSFGLTSKGIDLAVDQHNQNLYAPYKDKIEAVRADIIAGKIKVPDYYEMQKQSK